MDFVPRITACMFAPQKRDSNVNSALKCAIRCLIEDEICAKKYMCINSLLHFRMGSAVCAEALLGAVQFVHSVPEGRVQ